MSHVVNGRDSNGQRRGVKCFDGQAVKAGSIILRQASMRFRPGLNVGMGKDYTLFALTPGKVDFDPRRIVSVVASESTEKKSKKK